MALGGSFLRGLTNTVIFGIFKVACTLYWSLGIFMLYYNTDARKLCYSNPGIWHSICFMLKINLLAARNERESVQIAIRPKVSWGGTGGVAGVVQVQCSDLCSTSGDRLMYCYRISYRIYGLLWFYADIILGRLVVGQSLKLRRVVPILGVPDALVPVDLPVSQISLYPGYLSGQYFSKFYTSKVLVAHNGGWITSSDLSFVTSSFLQGDFCSLGINWCSKCSTPRALWGGDCHNCYEGRWVSPPPTPKWLFTLDFVCDISIHMFLWLAVITLSRSPAQSIVKVEKHQLFEELKGCLSIVEPIDGKPLDEVVGCFVLFCFLKYSL